MGSAVVSAHASGGHPHHTGYYLTGQTTAHHAVYLLDALGHLLQVRERNVSWSYLPLIFSQCDEITHGDLFYSLYYLIKLIESSCENAFLFHSTVKGYPVGSRSFLQDLTLIFRNMNPVPSIQELVLFYHYQTSCIIQFLVHQCGQSILNHNLIHPKIDSDG